MKNFKLSVLCLLTISLFAGCSLKGDFYSQLQNTIPYLRSSTAIITQVVLSEAVSDEDRKEKAKKVMEVAEMIEAMTENGDVSLEVFASKLSYFVPDKSHWHEFASALILVYADFYARASELDETSKQKMLIQALNRIAAGCKVAASSYAN